MASARPAFPHPLSARPGGAGENGRPPGLPGRQVGGLRVRRAGGGDQGSTRRQYWVDRMEEGVLKLGVRVSMLLLPR